MIVFNLSCQQEHAFEGWFRSTGDFDDQKSRGLLSCPVCGETQITKKLSAPRLNVSASRESRGLTVKGGAEESSRVDTPMAAPVKTEVPSTNTPSTNVPGPTIEQMQALWYRMAREVIAKTEDVGDKFAEEARKMHYQESPERAIRGKASAEEAKELSEEGIDIYSMPIPESLKNPLQ